MPERPYYIVAVINQASGQIEDTLPSRVLHFDEADAEWERDLRADEAAQAGRHDRYIVCEVIPVEEDSATLPTDAQIRAWLTAHGWTAKAPGFAGALWTPPGGAGPVGVPHDTEDAEFMAGAIKRIANREGRPVDEVTREMLAVREDGDG